MDICAGEVRGWACRANNVPGWASRITGLTRVLGAVLLLASLSVSVQAVQSVTVAWNPSPDTNVAGYFRYYGSPTGNYTNKLDVGNVTNATVSGLVEGSTYFLAVTAYSTLGLELDFSNEVSYTVPLSNSLPTITLTSPATGATYTAPAAISLATTVTANGHTITKVQFYNGATLLGEDTSAPYSFAWTNVSAGSYNLTAKVLYDSGSTLASSIALISVTAVVPALTSIAVTPSNPTLLAGATQQFAATGTYSDGSTQNLTSQATWTSSSNAVALVNASGLVTAVSVGTTTLSAALSGVTGRSTATVIANPPVITLTSPANGATYTAPAAISLAATVTANGHTITKVQFYTGATLLGEDTSAPYNFAWTNVSAGSYSLMARAVYDAGSTVDSSPVNSSVTGLPAPWQTADIGSVAVVGSASMSNGIYTVKGAGNMSGTADNFRFVYQPLSGDGEIKVCLISVDNTGASGRIGVMIREGLTSGSEYAFMGIPPDGTFRSQSRNKTGGSTWSTTSSVGAPPNVWARLVRTGNTLYCYMSTDGTTWTQVNSRRIAMATNIYIGLAVASGSSTTLNTATFTNMTVVP